MSFYNDASLVFLPSGGAGKDGKAYSIKPRDGSGDFTFSRGSNLTATRVDSNGLIEKGRENLLLQSNQFDTTWALRSTSVTSGQSGYDSSSDAWLLNSTTTGFPRIEQNVTSSGVATYSFYAKAATDGFILMRTFGADSQVWFNLTDGLISNASGSQYVSSNIQSVGNGWYRCSIVVNGSITSVRIYPASSYGTYSTNGNGVYIQDAQLEQGLVATEYIESGATTGKAGILEDSPRFDYSGGASCPSLLLEPSRTNLIGYSEYLEGTGWTAQAGITLTPNTTETLSPEGLNNAYKVVSTDATKGFYISGLNVTNDAVRTIYLKGSVGGETIVFKDPSGFGTPSTKTLTTDWQRFEMATTNDGNTYQGLFIDDISVGTIYAYGAQVEEASYPTSYIPNHSGGSVTREEDTTAELTLSPSYGSSNTWFFELKRVVSTDESNQSIAIIKNDSTGANNRFTIFSTNNGRFRVLLSDGSGTTENLYSPNDSFEQGETIKAAVKITPSGCTLFVDGSSVATSSSVGTITGIDAITYFRKAALKQFLIFPTALSDANCITLTS